MRKEHKKKLNENRRIIVGHLRDLEGVLDYLISKHVFTPAIRERIIYDNRVSTDRVRQMLDVLVSRNPLSYQYFLESLILTNNNHIANILDPDYCQSEECRLMIERENIILPQYSQQVSAQQEEQQHHHHPQNSICNHPLTSNFSYPILCTHHFSLNEFSTPPPIHPNRFMRHSNSALPYYLLQYNNNNHSDNNSNFSSQTNSRSSSQSQSISPTLNRARSSSVTNVPLRYPNTRKRNGQTGCTSNIEELYQVATPVPVSSSCDENDQWSPQNSDDRPSIYTIEWSDVNSLELDFRVFQTHPNIRKQLREECYCMEKKPRGSCLIINNEHFYGADGIEMSILRRNGTTMDASRLKNLFEKLHFSVEMCVDLIEKDMRSKINSYANQSRINSDAYDAICLIILSHGTDGYVYGVDYENRINIERDILDLFDDIMNKKPKLFIFQACRGENLNQKDHSILVGTSSKSPLNSPVSSLSTTSNNDNNLKPKIIIQDHKSVLSNSNGEDENLNKKLNDLKLSCIQSNRQMKYKKNSASISKSKIKTRSRSHSRGKYSAYLASAATAFKTAIKISPNSNKTQILTTTSTQTCSKIVSSSSNEMSTNQVKIENYYQEDIYKTAASNVLNFTDGRPIKTFMPSRSDFFIWYSSVRGFVSMRDPDGSPFIKCLVTVFSRCAYELELLEMVRKVNMLMQQYEMNAYNERTVAQYFMVPVPEYHLSKRLYFNP